MGNTMVVIDMLDELTIIKEELKIDPEVGHAHATIFLWKHEKLILNLIELQLQEWLRNQGGESNGKRQTN